VLQPHIDCAATRTLPECTSAFRTSGMTVGRATQASQRCQWWCLREGGGVVPALGRLGSAGIEMHLINDWAGAVGPGADGPLTHTLQHGQ
jgi:hypothetical protein